MDGSLKDKSYQEQLSKLGIDTLRQRRSIFDRLKFSRLWLIYLLCDFLISFHLIVTKLHVVTNINCQKNVLG